MTDERHLRVARGQIPNLDQALAWAVQTYDRDFPTATMVKIEVEQIYASIDGDDWHYEWVGSVSGTVKEGP